MDLKKYILAKGMTTTSFAAKCGMSYPQIYRILKGITPTLENGIRITTYTKNNRFGENEYVSYEDLVSKEELKEIKSDVSP